MPTDGNSTVILAAPMETPSLTHRFWMEISRRSHLPNVDRWKLPAGSERRCVFSYPLNFHDPIFPCPFFIGITPGIAKDTGLADMIIHRIIHMTMNPDLGFPALNVMLLIGTETARYGTARESGILTAEAGRMMGDDHCRPLQGATPWQGAAPSRGATLMSLLLGRGKSPCPFITILPHRKSAPALFAIDPEFAFPVYAADAAIWMAIMVQANTNLAGGGALVANEVAIVIALSLHDTEC